MRLWGRVVGRSLGSADASVVDEPDVFGCGPSRLARQGGLCHAASLGYLVVVRSYDGRSTLPVVRAGLSASRPFWTDDRVGLPYMAAMVSKLALLGIMARVCKDYCRLPVRYPYADGAVS